MPDSEPQVDVIEVRGEKRVAFQGLQYLELSIDEEDDLLDRYEELLIRLDDIADEYDGVNRAWHIGKTLVEYNVGQDTEITLADVAKYNSIDVDERRMTYCRNVYQFFPDQKYDEQHSVTALGELASRSRGQGREDEATTGYTRIREAGLEMTRNDIFAWWDLADADYDRSLNGITAAVAQYYDHPQNMIDSIHRVSLLAGFDIESESREQIIEVLKANVNAR
jgi:hypothetical protein